MIEDEIKNNILTCAKQEFMEKGYLNASMRNIASLANLTTGSLYNRFKTKDDIFDCLVSKGTETVLNCFINAQKEFASFSANEQNSKMHNYTMSKVSEMVDLIYDNFDSIKLVICKSNGSKYETYIEQFVSIETENTDRFIKCLKNSNIKVNEVREDLNHILASAMFNAIFETVRHDKSREDAHIFVKQIYEFFAAGWDHLLGKEIIRGGEQ